MFSRHFEFLRKKTIGERNEWFVCQQNKLEELEKIRSGEGLMLETLAFQICRCVNPTFINCFDKTKFVSHSHRHSTTVHLETSNL